jgi:hypothetical protein
LNSCSLSGSTLEKAKKINENNYQSNSLKKPIKNIYSLCSIRTHTQKASDQEIYKAYLNLKNVWKVGKYLGMCGQSIHERLQKMGLNNSINILTCEEKIKIENFYREGFLFGDGKMQALSKELKRTRQFIARYAQSIGLTNFKRTRSLEYNKRISLQRVGWWSNRIHPKGMLGKKHSQEFCKKQSFRFKSWHVSLSDEFKAKMYKKAVITARERGNYDRKHGSWKQEWKTIGGKKKFFRSRWEVNYAKYLEFLKVQGKISDWLHEPETFWFNDILRGARSYLPDFKIINLDGTHSWVEVKGWMDDRSKTKLKRFKKYYPEEKIEVVRGDWFKKNADILSGLCQWE